MAESAQWLAQFHAGDRDTMAELYRDHFETTRRAARMLPAGDQETVVHEVFYRLLTSESMRQGFRGGSISGWMATVTRNHAVDYARKHHRDVSFDELSDGHAPPAEEDRAVEARALVERFVRDELPKKWQPMFELRFLRSMTQRDAARQLGISRTTLAYQELRTRRLLERFCLSDRPSS